MSVPLRRLVPLVPLAATLVVPVAAQTWQLASPTAAPPARWATAMTTDLANATTLLFGGYDGTYRNDTWMYDGSTWSNVAGTAPVARGSHGMAFDSVRGAHVMFGGINGVAVSSYRSDTWEYQNGVWTQRVVATHPTARFGHAMAFDPLRGRTVLFGGRTNAGTIFLDDVWEWDGNAWVGQIPTPRPSRRMGAAMAFDPVSGRVLLFGGQPIGGLPVGDTWAWDGTTWTQLAPTMAPSGRTQAVLALDPVRQRLVLFGGYDGGDLTDTWEWDGSAWHSIVTTVAPAAFGVPGFASAPNGHHVVLFGGQAAAGNGLADTWTFGHVAAAVGYGQGCGVPPLHVAASSGSVPALGQSFVSTMTNVPTGGLPFANLGLSRTDAGGVPLPLDLSPLGMPGCWLLHDAGAIGLPCTLVGGVVTYVLPLPAAPSLAGARLYLQGAAFAPGVNAFGLLTSDGLELSLGWQ